MLKPSSMPAPAFRKRSRRWLLPISLGGLGLALAALTAALWWTPAPLKVIDAGGGTTLTFVGVTGSGGREYVPGPLWRALLFRVSPPALRAKWMPDACWLSPAPHGCLAVWSILRAKVGLLFQASEPCLVPQDQSGFPCGSLSVPSISLPSTSAVYVMSPGVPPTSPASMSFVQEHAVAVFPRRQARIALRILDLGFPTRALGPLVVPNPGPTAFPTWTPESLPATRRVGRMQITLRQFSLPRTRSGSAPQAAARADVRITARGRLLDHCLPHALELTDATGNRCVTGWFDRERPDSVHAWLDEAPVPGEALKLRMQFVGAEGFPHDRLVELRRVPVPMPGRTVRLGWKVAAGTATVRLTSVAVTRKGPLRVGLKLLQHGRPAPPDLVLYPVRGSASGSPDLTWKAAVTPWNNAYVQFNFHRPARGRFVNLVFALEHPVTVEYTVRQPAPRDR